MTNLTQIPRSSRNAHSPSIPERGSKDGLLVRICGQFESKQKMLQTLHKQESQMIDLVRKDYKDWNRKETVSYDIRPSMLKGMSSCRLTVSFDGDLLFKKDNDHLLKKLGTN